jgi:hypothetical protein
MTSVEISNTIEADIGPCLFKIDESLCITIVSFEYVAVSSQL